MAEIVFDSVSVEYPILDGSRSFRSEIKRSIGGVISREARSKHLRVLALDRVSVVFAKGDRVGLVGRNGAGKSTMLRVIAGVYPTTGGRLTIKGRVTPLLAIEAGMNFDETGYENITTCGLYRGRTRAEVLAQRDEIAQFSELGDFLSMPVRTYSSGMQMRLAFAIATSGSPEILLLDEVIGAGDEQFAIKARARMQSLMQQASIIVMASHAAELVESYCNKALWLDGGRVVAFGAVEDVLKQYHSGKAMI
jgi:ABC-2 type transport system ATP-binding protein/lipopolysaccharide transport system ATP-binding protein